jgi:glutathione S-transferase
MLELVGATGPFVRKVRIVLAEKGIPFRLVEESPYAPDSPVALLNPLSKIPVLLTEDGTALFDSRVIVEYLDAISPANRLLPDELTARTAVKRWEALADGVADALIAIVVERKRPETAEGRDWIARQRVKVERGVGGIARDLGTRPWCCGDGLTLADVATGCALFHLDLRLPEYDWRALYPDLAKLAEQLAARPSFAATKPVAA